MINDSSLQLTAKKRVAICGLHDECSTFCPHQATAEDFTVTRGTKILARYPWLAENSQPEWAQAVQWIPILHARSVPSGPVKRDAYEAWKQEIIAGIRSAHESEQGPLDGVYFDIHGAMYVTGVEDMEGELIAAIREIIGPEPLVSCTMDLHGNVSRQLFRHCDLITCFRIAPHEDTWQTRERGARKLVEHLVNDLPKPAKALVYVPILLPGEKTSTRLEPAKSLYKQLDNWDNLAGVEDGGIWIGYAWGDEPRASCAVVVYGDDTKVVEAEALRLAQDIWRERKNFRFVAPADNFKACLEQAVRAPKESRPFFISDSGDNPGAGGADDVTYALEIMLQEPAFGCKGLEGASVGDTVYGFKGRALKGVFASLVDPVVVSQAKHVGLGKTVTLEVGGKIDTRPPGPLRVSAQVGAFGVDPLGGECVRLDVGKLHVFITERRMQFSELEMYRRLGVEPNDMDIICVKIGYLEPQLHEIARGWCLALTPGGVDQDILRLDYKRIKRPMFPLDPDMAEPVWEVFTE